MSDITAPNALKTAAFTDILMRFQWPLYTFLRGIVSDQEQAHDLVQDVFCDGWRAVQRAASPFDGQGDEETIRRWLFHAAYCRAISTLRRRRLIRWDSLDALHEHEGEEEASLLTLPFEDAVLEATVLRATFAALTPESIALLLLNIVHDFSTAEIAEIVGISLAATKKRLSRAKQRLRAEYLARNPLTQESSAL
jgi:RNA polymerase sigma-70 factor (ECF subfamily)